MRMIKLWCAVALVLAGCDAIATGTTAQAVAGPGGVMVTAQVAGQLAVSWAGDPMASKYYVFVGPAASGPFAFAASVLNPDGSPPAPTSWTATGLTGGASYCYTVEAAYPDGSISDPGAAGCGTATGSGTTPSPRTIVVPVVPAGLGSFGVPDIGARIGNIGIDPNGSVLYVQLPLVVGTVIRGWRVRERDAGSGTTVSSALLSTADGAEAPTTLAQSTTSEGTGVEGTISGTANITAAPATMYTISVFDQTGVGVSRVYRLEVDED